MSTAVLAGLVLLGVQYWFFEEDDDDEHPPHHVFRYWAEAAEKAGERNYGQGALVLEQAAIDLDRFGADRTLNWPSAPPGAKKEWKAGDLSTHFGAVATILRTLEKDYGPLHEYVANLHELQSVLGPKSAGRALPLAEWLEDHRQMVHTPELLTLRYSGGGAAQFARGLSASLEPLDRLVGMIAKPDIQESIKGRDLAAPEFEKLKSWPLTEADADLTSLFDGIKLYAKLGDDLAKYRECQYRWLLAVDDDKFATALRELDSMGQILGRDDAKESPLTASVRMEACIPPLRAALGDSTASTLSAAQADARAGRGYSGSTFDDLRGLLAQALQVVKHRDAVSGVVQQMSKCLVGCDMDGFRDALREYRRLLPRATGDPPPPERLLRELNAAIADLHKTCHGRRTDLGLSRKKLKTLLDSVSFTPTLYARLSELGDRLCRLRTNLSSVESGFNAYNGVVRGAWRRVDGEEKRTGLREELARVSQRLSRALTGGSAGDADPTASIQWERMGTALLEAEESALLDVDVAEARLDEVDRGLGGLSRACASLPERIDDIPFLLKLSEDVWAGIPYPMRQQVLAAEHVVNALVRRRASIEECCRNLGVALEWPAELECPKTQNDDWYRAFYLPVDEDAHKRLRSCLEDEARRAYKRIVRWIEVLVARESLSPARAQLVVLLNTRYTTQDVRRAAMDMRVAWDGSAYRGRVKMTSRPATVAECLRLLVGAWGNLDLFVNAPDVEQSEDALAQIDTLLDVLAGLTDQEPPPPAAGTPNPDLRKQVLLRERLLAAMRDAKADLLSTNATPIPGAIDKISAALRVIPGHTARDSGRLDLLESVVLAEVREARPHLQATRRAADASSATQDPAAVALRLEGAIANWPVPNLQVLRREADVLARGIETLGRQYSHRRPPEPQVVREWDTAFRSGNHHDAYCFAAALAYYHGTQNVNTSYVASCIGHLTYVLRKDRFFAIALAQKYLATHPNDPHLTTAYQGLMR